MTITRSAMTTGGFVLSMAMLAIGTSAFAGISATKHNLSVSGSSNSVYSSDQPEICVFCHTPHQAIKNANIPLWNHNLSSVASYGVYDSPTFDASVANGGDIADLGGVDETNAAVSNLCLSCHDGTVAINSLNNASNINPTTTMVGTDPAPDNTLLDAATTNLGTDLQDDHPVNFTYGAALFGKDPTLQDPSTLANVKLYNEKVQCASCHDPHTSDQGAFLRTTMTASALCMECHNK